MRRSIAASVERPEFNQAAGIGLAAILESTSTTMDNKDNLAIDSKVEIIPHGVVGIIDAVYTDRRGVQYNVEYKDASGAIQNRYYSPEQLRAA